MALLNQPSVLCPETRKLILSLRYYRESPYRLESTRRRFAIERAHMEIEEMERIEREQLRSKWLAWTIKLLRDWFGRGPRERPMKANAAWTTDAFNQRHTPHP